MVSFKSVTFTLAVIFLSGSQFLFVNATETTGTTTGASGEAQGAGKDAAAKDGEKKNANEDDKKLKAHVIAILNALAPTQATGVFHTVLDKSYHKLDGEDHKDFVKENKDDFAKKEKELVDKLVHLKKRAETPVEKEKDKEGDAAKEFKELLNEVSNLLAEMKAVVDKAYDKARGHLSGDDQKEFEHDVFKLKAKFVANGLGPLAKLVEEVHNQVKTDGAKKLVDEFKDLRANVDKHKQEVEKFGEDVDHVKNFAEFRDEAKKAADKSAEAVDALVTHRNDNNVEFDNELLDKIKEFVDQVVNVSKAYIPALGFSILMSAVFL